MEYRNLGRAGVQVSALSLGAMTFGEPDATSFMHGLAASEEESGRILDAAREAGVNLIDTADVYGNDGLSERVLGRWLADRRCRDELLIASKCRMRMRPGPLGVGASRHHIVRSVEQSLRRLQTDRLDLYQIHMQDAHTGEGEILRALDDLVRQGKILYYGLSNFAAYRLVQADWICERHHYAPVITLQARYNLAQRDLEREHLPYMRQSGLGLLAYSPLAGGLLSGKYSAEAGGPEGSRLAAQPERLAALDTPHHWAVVRALAEAAEALDTTSAAVALAWLLGRPGVSSVILGARSLTQLQANLAAASLDLPAELRARLDAVSRPNFGDPYDFIEQVDGRW